MTSEGPAAKPVEAPAKGPAARHAVAASTGVSLATRHVMQANRSEDTKPELRVRQALRERGLPGYRLHWKKAPGRPDVCYPGRRLAIFVNGCYWHHCAWCQMALPKSNVEFWRQKFARNRARDVRDANSLASAGWTVLVVWECRLAKGRFEPTMDEVALEVRRAGDGGAHVGRVVEVGSPALWRLARARARIRGLRRSR